jgi:pimeloyl-[acyl-carrier protein] methyl ester esterase
MIGVLIPGWATGEWIMAPLQEALGYRWGIAHSNWADILNEECPSDPAEHLEALRFYEESRCLIGWSLGSLLALEVAARSPGVWDHLVLISPTLCMTGFGGISGTSGKVLRAMRLRLQRDREGTLRDFARMCHDPGQDTDFEEKFIQNAAGFSTEQLDRGLQYLAQTDLSERISEIDVPCTVISGREDRVIPWQAGQATADLCGGSCHVLKGVGHALPWTSASLLAQIIRDEVAE